MKRKIIISFGLSILVGIAAFYMLFSFRTININGEIPLKSKNDLILDSDTIVRGVVKEVLPSQWSNQGLIKGENIRNILQTDIRVAIAEVFSGMPYDNNSIVVRINKGNTLTTKVISDGYPDFFAGEEVILFLSRDDGDLANPNENYYVLTGMIQGKFVLDPNGGSGKEFKSAFEGSVDKIVLAGFKDEIKKAVEEEKINPRKKLTKEQIREKNERFFGANVYQ